MKSANRMEMREESIKTKKWNIRMKFESIILWCKTLVRIYQRVGNWIVAVDLQFEEEHWRWFVGGDGLQVEMVALVCQSQNWVHWPIHFYHCKFKFLISFLHIILKIEIWILFLEIHTEETRHLMVCTGFPFQRMRILNPTRIYSTSK